MYPGPGTIQAPCSVVVAAAMCVCMSWLHASGSHNPSHSPRCSCFGFVLCYGRCLFICGWCGLVGQDLPEERKPSDLGPLLPQRVTLDNPSRDYTPPQVSTIPCFHRGGEEGFSAGSRRLVFAVLWQGCGAMVYASCFLLANYR